MGFDRGPEPKEQQMITKEDEQKAATWKELVVSKQYRSVMVFNLAPQPARL